jgi:heme/copper-type cytochrome/quinol oxidase subunit 2
MLPLNVPALFLSFLALHLLLLVVIIIITTTIIIVTVRHHRNASEVRQNKKPQGTTQTARTTVTTPLQWTKALSILTTKITKQRTL